MQQMRAQFSVRIGRRLRCVRLVDSNGLHVIHRFQGLTVAK